MKFLQTFLKGKLTGLGIIGVLLNDLLANWANVSPTWEAAAGGEASVLQIIASAAVLWGVFRRFTQEYKNEPRDN